MGQSSSSLEAVAYSEADASLDESPLPLAARPPEVAIPYLNWQAAVHAMTPPPFVIEQVLPAPPQASHPQRQKQWHGQSQTATRQKKKGVACISNSASTRPCDDPIQQRGAQKKKDVDIFTPPGTQFPSERVPVSVDTIPEASRSTHGEDCEPCRLTARGKHCHWGSRCRFCHDGTHVRSEVRRPGGATRQRAARRRAAKEASEAQDRAAEERWDSMPMADSSEEDPESVD